MDDASSSIGSLGYISTTDETMDDACSPPAKDLPINDKSPESKNHKSKLRRSMEEVRRTLKKNMEILGENENDEVDVKRYENVLENNITVMAHMGCLIKEQKEKIEDWKKKLKCRKKGHNDGNNGVGGCSCYYIVPGQNFKDPKFIQMANTALGAYNSENGEDFQFHKVVCVSSSVDGVLFYMNFQAKNPKEGDAVKTLLAKIHYGVQPIVKVEFSRLRQS